MYFLPNYYRDIGKLVMVLSLFIIVPLIISIVGNEGILILKEYILSFIFIFCFGVLLFILAKKEQVKLPAKGLKTVGLSWIMVSIAGAIPFIFVLKKTWYDALFESISGFTTTGITVFSGLDQMPASIIMWRGMIQWLGGLGILTFFLLLSIGKTGENWQLFSAEGHKINASRAYPNIFKTIRSLWLIYTVLTFLEMSVLKMFGMSFFDAILHSFTTLSTGGFSNHDLSIAYFRNGAYNFRGIEYTLVLFMFLGGCNFLLHFRVAKEGFKVYRESREFKTYLGIVITTVIIILVGGSEHFIFSFNEIEAFFRNTLFQVVSVLTTTGFGTVDLFDVYFSEVARLVFLILMFIGGCVGSTSGGFKVMRMILLKKSLNVEVRKNFYSEKASLPVSLEKKVVPRTELLRVANMVFAWITLIFLGSLWILLRTDLTGYQAISGMTSAVSNIGPFFFSVDKMISLPIDIKMLFGIGMLAGRLEMFPMLILFSRKR